MNDESARHGETHSEDIDPATLQPLLQIAIKEWSQTIGEAKSGLEGEKEITKQTIVITLTVFASLTYFLASDTLDKEQKLALSPLFIVFPAIYLVLSFYSFYHTFYRFMISRYWLEELFPRLELLLATVPAIKHELDTRFPQGTLPFHLIRWQAFYRNESSWQAVLAIFAYRGIPLFLGMPISIAYVIFLIQFRRSNIDEYVPFWLTVTLGSVITVTFLLLVCILCWGMRRMLTQAEPDQ